MTLYKIFKYLAVAIGIIAAFFTIRIIVAGEDTVTASADLQASVVSPFMYLTYIVMAVTIVLTIIFSVKGLFTGDPKKTLIPLGVLIAIVLIAYLVTTGEARETPNGEMLSASAVHWVSTGLVVFYILGIFAIGTMLYGGIRKLIK